MEDDLPRTQALEKPTKTVMHARATANEGNANASALMVSTSFGDGPVPLLHVACQPHAYNPQQSYIS